MAANLVVFSKVAVGNLQHDVVPSPANVHEAFEDGISSNAFPITCTVYQ